MHGDIQEVCGSNIILTALVLKFAGVRWRSCYNDFLSDDSKHLSACTVERSAFIAFLVRLHGHIHNCSVQAFSRL